MHGGAGSFLIGKKTLPHGQGTGGPFLWGEGLAERGASRYTPSLIAMPGAHPGVRFGGVAQLVRAQDS